MFCHNHKPTQLSDLARVCMVPSRYAGPIIIPATISKFAIHISASDREPHREPQWQPSEAHVLRERHRPRQQAHSPRERQGPHQRAFQVSEKKKLALNLVLFALELSIIYLHNSCNKFKTIIMILRSWFIIWQSNSINKMSCHCVQNLVSNTALMRLL